MQETIEGNSKLQLQGMGKSAETQNAKKACIKQKCVQNSTLADFLINCSENKMIVECSTGSLWVTAVPLNPDDCLDRSMWLHQGILGEILMEVCSELKGNDYSPPVNTPLNRNQSNREHNRYDSITNSAIPEHL